ncbi:MAG: HAD family hydrolase [Thermodesulfobacteriota bacterium]
MTKYISIKGRKTGCRLIIFDKDGTLTDFSTIWIPLTKKRIACILEEVNGPDELGKAIMRAWGVDPLTDLIDPRGPCVSAPQSEETLIAATVLYQNGYPWNEAKQAVERALERADSLRNYSRDLKPVMGMREILKGLKDSGFLLALATCDLRNQTEEILRILGISHLFDLILSAEEVSHPKPHPQMVLTICKRLNTSPAETILVGDTEGDMTMGKKAGIALTVGVLEGGITPRAKMEEVADVVIDSLSEIHAL